MRNLIRVSLAAAVVVVVTAATVQSADWGSLKGRFVYDGKVPDRVRITPTKDIETCGKYEIYVESVWVDSDGGLANVLVSLYTKRGKRVDVHPDYTATATGEVVIDNNGCRFEPHITLMRTSQTLVVRNSDPVGHNTNCQLLKNNPFNQIIPAGQSISKMMKKAEARPAQVSCNIHTWMQAYLVVRDDPYMAVSAEDGRFEITNIPAGMHQFGFWHESPGYLRKMSIGGETSDRKGRVKLKFAAGETLDLGDVKIPAKMFK